MKRLRNFATAGIATAIVGLVLVGCTPAFLTEEFAANENAVSDSVTKLNLANAKVAALAYLIDNPSLPPHPATDLADNGWPQNEPVVNVVTTASSGTEFCLWAVSASGTSFMTTDSEPTVNGDCG